MARIEAQLGQVSERVQMRPEGKFPPSTEKNPQNECKAITLRSGKNVVAPLKEDCQMKPKPEKEETRKKEEYEDTDSLRKKGINSLPYPQRGKQEKEVAK